MKRTIAIALGLAMVGLVSAYVGGQVMAQQSGAQPTTVQAPAQTRIGFVNVAYVFQKYRKAQVYKDEMENSLKPKKQEIDKLKDEVLRYSQELQKQGISAQNKEQYEKYITWARRQIEDKTKEMQQAFLKKMEDQTVQIYKEVNEVVRVQAQSNGFHIVLAYAEPIEGDVLSLPNINRKVQGMDLGGGLSPMYFHPGLDISQGVVNTLNAQYAGGGAGVVPTNFKK